MTTYSFTYKDKNYLLSEEKCSAMYNDELHPITGIDFEEIITLLNQAEDVPFEMEYFDIACDGCKANQVISSKNYSFLEYHFYLFTKDSQYVLSNISKEYQINSFIDLKRKGIVDESYLISILVCPNCSEITIELEYCDF